MTVTSFPAGRRATRVRATIAAAGCCLCLVACGGPTQSAAPVEPANAPSVREPVPYPADVPVDAAGTLAPPETAIEAFTYNSKLAPAGARLAVTATAPLGRTVVRLEVGGLLSNRGYAAHVHQLPCGATGAAAGPHHQNVVDPAATRDKASTDPAFANPRNEIWLDLRTDTSGRAAVSSEVPFALGDRRPASVILHEAARTATEPGEAGTAGARVACLNVPFAKVRTG